MAVLLNEFLLYMGVSLLFFLVSIWRRGTFFAGIGVSAGVWELAILATSGEPTDFVALDAIILMALVVICELGWLIMVRQQQSELP